MSASDVGDPGSIPGSGRSTGEGNSNPLQYSCLENPKDGEAGYYSPRGRKESDTTEQLCLLTYLYLMLLLLSRFSRVRLCATPETTAHQAPLSLGFSGQEHWSGLPFPSPMHESEK